MSQTIKNKDERNPSPPKPPTAEPRVVQEGFNTRNYKPNDT